MDTDDLSNETYGAVIIEAERFHHNLTLHFGVLAGQCDTEEEYLDAAEKLVKKIMKAKSFEIEDFLFDEVDDLSRLPATLDKILTNIARVREIPEEKRTYECYIHTCLKYVSGEHMTNQSLRERFGILVQNYHIASRIISDTIKAGLIKDYDTESKSRKYAKYVPYWFLVLMLWLCNGVRFVSRKDLSIRYILCNSYVTQVKMIHIITQNEIKEIAFPYLRFL